LPATFPQKEKSAMRCQILKTAAILGAVLFLVSGSRASEHLVDNAKSALARAEGGLTKARDELQRAQRELDQATEAVAKNGKRLDIANKCIQVSKDEWGSQHKALIAAQNEFRRAADNVKRIRDQLDSKRVLEEELCHLRDGVLATEVLLYDMRWSLNIEFNAVTGSFNAWAEMPQGLELTSSAISAACSGGVPLPQFDLAGMLAASLGLRVERESTFDDLVARIHRGVSENTRVYVSSRGFSELFAPEHTVDGVWKAILSGGSTGAGSADEVANGCLRELNGVYAFLQETVPEEANELLKHIMPAILTHDHWETPTVELRAIKGEMKYTVKQGELTRLAKYLPGLAKRNSNVGKTLSVPRNGFAVFVRPKVQAGATQDLRAKFGKFKANGPDVLKTALHGESYRLLELAIDHSVDVSSVVAPGLSKLFRGFDYSRATHDEKDASLLDLRQTSIGKEFESFASKTLKIGKEGSARVSRLTIDAGTGQAAIVIDLRAKQSSTLREAIHVAKKSVEDVNDETVMRWKAAALSVERLHDEIPLATLELSHASSKISGLSEVLKIDQEHLTSVLAEQKAAQAALDEATRARTFSQGRRDAAANAVERAEQNVKDLGKLITKLSRL
jgi:hypothetical protein